MGKETSEKQINPLVILKITIPLIFPLVGFLISPFISDESLSEIDSFDDSIEEQEKEIVLLPHISRDEFKFQQNNQEIVTLQGGRIDQLENEKPNLEREIGNLRSMICEIEERQKRMNSQFNEYYNVKTHESLVEKLQIMCLGLKLECIEKEELNAIRVELNRLKRRNKKILRVNARNYHVFHRKMRIFEAREAELMRKNQELEMAARDVENMREPKEKCTFKTTDLVIEHANATNIKKNKEIFDQIRAKWMAEIEEMIYLGFITTSLQQELSINKIEIFNQNSRKESKHDKEILSLQFSPRLVPHEERETAITVEIPTSRDEAQNCTALILHETNGGTPKSNLDCERYLKLRKPKLIQKFKGWAKGKGKCKRSSI